MGSSITISIAITTRPERAGDARRELPNDAGVFRDMAPSNAARGNGMIERKLRKAVSLDPKDPILLENMG